MTQPLVINHGALINLGEPVVRPAGKGDTVGADLDAPIRILIHVDVASHQPTVRLCVIEQVDYPVILQRQRTRDAPRFTPRQDGVEILILTQRPVRIEGAPWRLAKARVGVPSRKGFFRTLSLRVGRFRGAQRPESAFGDAFVGVPHVVARQVDVIPAQWRDVRDKAFVDLPLLP
ncbi:hypothetical protein P3T23_008942 [Paraburkholderia sp. GAS448]